METYAIWLIVGSITLIVELLAGTMFLIWIACGCFLAGAAAWLFGQWPWLPWAVFVVSTAALLWLGRRLANRIHSTSGMPSNVDALVGQTAVVLEPIDPLENTGRVRIGSDEWRARATTRFEEKELVRVIGVEGTTVIVASLEGGHTLSAGEGAR